MTIKHIVHVYIHQSDEHETINELKKIAKEQTKKLKTSVEKLKIAFQPNISNTKTEKNA